MEQETIINVEHVSMRFNLSQRSLTVLKNM